MLRELVFLLSSSGLDIQHGVRSLAHYSIVSIMSSKGGGGGAYRELEEMEKRLCFYMTATEYDGKADNVKASLLIHCIGDKAR